MTQSDRNELITRVMEQIKDWPKEELIKYTQFHIDAWTRALNDDDLADYCNGLGISLE